MKNVCDIGVLGLGRLFKSRLVNLFKNEVKNITLKAVFDINKFKNKSYAKKLRLKPCLNISDFLKQDLDFVYVATESGNHFKHSELILNASKNVILEKPPTLTVNQLEKLIKLKNKRKKKVYVVFQNRFNKSVKFFKKEINKINTRDILNVALNLEWSRDKKYYSDWHGKWKMDGGVLAQQGVHYIDLLCTFFGKPKKAISYYTNKKNSIQCEDTIFAMVEFEKNVLVQIFLTTAMKNKDIQASIELTSKNKKIKIAGLCCNEYYSMDLKRKNPQYKIMNRYSTKVPNGYGLSHKEVLEAVANPKKKGLECATLEDSVNTIKLINMIYLSFEKNRWVYGDEKKIISKLGR